MKMGILIFPGAHGDRELSRVLEQEYGIEASMISHRECELNGLDVLFIPGGFPCKGSSTSPSCMEESPIVDAMLEYADKGKILIGVGNGFRVLCETGLVPGTLKMNRNQRFVCTHTHIKADNENTALTRHLSSGSAYRIPMATGYGRFAAKEETLVQMRYNDQILFRYCDDNGRISEEVNPTGAIDNIAGVCNERKNVFGLVPQPERALLPFGSNRDGKAIFDSLLAYLG